MPVDIRTFASDPAQFQAELIIPSAHGSRRFGDVMADFQRERFDSINPALLAVARGEKPPIGRFWWEATKGASKDSDLAVCLLWLLCFTGRPLSCQVGAADADQADELRKAAKDVLRLNGWLASRVEILAWKIVATATGSEAEIIAADVAGSHGARPDVLVLNELSHIGKQEFAENLFDNAAKVPQGLAIIATNAGFLGTWQAKWRDIARTSDRWHFNQYAQPSPWLDLGELDEAARRNSQSRFKRLWWGVWSSGAGDALDPADIQAAIRDDLAPMTGTSRRVVPPRGPAVAITGDQFGFAGGLDLSVSQDHSALVILASDGATQRVRLADCKWWAPDATTGKVDLVAIEAAVLDAHERFRLDAVWFDPWQCALMAQRLERAGVRMRERHFGGKNLDLMATTLLETFRSRRIDLYPCERLVADLHRLSIVEKSYGHKLEAVRDKDGHADTAIAFAIALPAAVDGIRSAPRREFIDDESWKPSPLKRWTMTFGGIDPTRFES